MGPKPITIRFCRIWMGAWTSIYQQFWCSARYQDFDPADVSNLGGIFEYSVVLEITQHWMISLGSEEIRISVMHPPSICWYLKHWKFTAGYPMATWLPQLVEPQLASRWRKDPGGRLGSWASKITEILWRVWTYQWQEYENHDRY